MASLVAVVLGCLPRLGACAHLAARLLRAAAGGRPGRAALAAGAARWRAICLGPAAEAVDSAGALQWAAGRLWQHLGELPSPHDLCVSCCYARANMNSTFRTFGRCFSCLMLMSARHIF